ncbi:ABC transporter ATP-binding protein [Ottowia thiooxydans]|uniref:Branched-chain amino acid transport system ATP-binding protein n=1 Tax=Ottowia thiooxydans TaxID=219182 RepID=A0ABV2QC61_9BURK
MLAIKSLSRSFGGVAAVDNVSFDVQSGHVHSVIGPNGAGKTTLFNLISGVYEPSSGEVLLDNTPINGLPPEELARRGMCRTFQNLQICMNMTACENVMLGAHLHANTGLWSGFLGLTRTADRKLEARAYELMDYVGVESARHAHATQLSFGVLKRLEIARALAANPRLLLLDEPAAGLNDSETHAVGELIRKIAAGGTTVLLVEHDMKMVMAISDHIVVMDQGKKLAEGTAQQVRANPAVVAAYLGVDA